MDHLSIFMVYALLFRLAIIAVGALAIFCGYRLFCLPLAASGDAELNAKLGDYEFSLKRAAPGTFFVLFGVVVVGLMVYQGNPEFLREEMPAQVANEVGSGDTVVSRIHVKSNEGSIGFREYEARLKQASQWYLNGEQARAVNEFHALLRTRDLPMIMAAYPINALAWDALQHQHYERALAYAVLAVEIEPDNPDFVDTLLRSHQLLPDNGIVPGLLARLQVAGKQQQADTLQHKLQQEVRP